MKKTNIDGIIEQLQEIGKTSVINIDNLGEIMTELEELGYITELSPDTDYLVLKNRIRAIGIYNSESKFTKTDDNNWEFYIPRANRSWTVLDEEINDILDRWIYDTNEPIDLNSDTEEDDIKAIKKWLKNRDEI
jgi:hypothetical protein